MIKAVLFDMFETLITHYHSPLYFGAQMAADAKIPKESFQELWRATEEARTLGEMTLEEALKMILKKNHCYSDELLEVIVKKRVAAKEECFRQLHPEILTMLEELKNRGILIGLISNCFSEEAKVIRKSGLFPYFSAACLSCELGVQKPDEAIFRRCMAQLQVKAPECLYIGDGGSFELEAARRLGMKAGQATWYLSEEASWPLKRKEEFLQLETPLDILKQI